MCWLCSRRAAVLAVAAGTAFGLTAALIKGMTETFSQGFTVLLTSWELYGMIAAGVLGVFLVQSAMNAGRLIAAQPGLTLSDPIVSILWGVLVFGERVRDGWHAALDPGPGMGRPGPGRGWTWRMTTSIRSASGRRCCGSTRW